MRPTTPDQSHGATVRRWTVDNDLIHCEVCGEAHPGARDCPWELFAAGLGSDPRTGGAVDNLTPDAEPVREHVTRLVERLDTTIRYGIPAIPEIVASAAGLLDDARLDGNDSAAEELRCIAEDLLGLATTLPDIAGRLCRLADAMEKT